MVVFKNSNRKETKMAHGIACKNCGWQEAYHTGLVNISEESEENPKKTKPGYRVPFNKCFDFEYSARNLVYAKKEQEKHPTTQGILCTLGKVDRYEQDWG